MAFYGKISRIDFTSGTVHEERTAENKYKTSDQLFHDFFSDEVKLLNVKFEDLRVDDPVWFTLVPFQGEILVSTIQIPEFED